MLRVVRGEAPILFVWMAAGLLFAATAVWRGHDVTGGALLALLVGLLGIIIWGAFGVMRHAEVLAARLGEPFGTLILTGAVTLIEVTVILSAMQDGSVATTLARDLVFAVLMIMLNGIVGLCLLVGGIKHREQSFNLPGTHAFLSVAFPLSVFALILPNYTTSTPGPTLSHLQAGILAGLILVLYGLFLSIQTVRHRGFFQELAFEVGHDERGPQSQHSTLFHGAALVLTLIPVVYLTEKLGRIITPAIATIDAPEAVAGVVVAALVLAPELMGAIRAALSNRLQRAVNIALGSAVATIGLTIPAVLLLSLLRHEHVTLGLQGEEMVLLAVTLLVSALTFSGARTNVLQGAVHIVMFLMFVLLLFDP